MRTFIILFLLGFFISCASHRTEKDEKRKNVGDEYMFPLIETPASLR